MSSRDSYDEALADTGIEPGGTANSGNSAERRGCLLQIYPVPDIPRLTRLVFDRAVLGRDSTCHITVDDPSVSRMHAIVEWSNGTYCLTDLNSTNGSWISGKKPDPQTPLAGGELIRLGNTILKFMMLPDEEAQYHSFVHELMARDALTNSFNRAWLMPLLGRELENCRQESFQLSVIFIDIDRFKLTNDKHGHLIGDEVLRTFCDRIHPVLNRTCSLCRFGGDEFVVVCPQSSLTVTVKIAEGIRHEISEKPFQTQAGQLNVTCSMGVTCTDGHLLSDVDELLSAADKLLYRAKSQGRNCIHCADGDAMSGESAATVV
ncbi:MAG: GGDEF domain-containing protein [Fuerstiella sp.]|nr:GGDEF domain-containing protein [Fuerstiella sp.]